MSPISHSIRPVDVERYKSDGVVCIRGVFDADWVNFIGEGFEHTLANPSEWFSDHAPEEGAGRFVTDLAMAHRHPTFSRFVHQSPAKDVVTALLQTSRLNFFFDSMWIKGAGIRKTTNWHQDMPYYTVDGDQMCVLWMSLDPIPAKTSIEFDIATVRMGAVGI